MTPARHPRTLLLPALALCAISLVWGYNWVISKKVLAYASPLEFAGLRTLLAALPLFLVIVWRRRPLAPQDLQAAVVLGLLQTTAFITLTLAALATGAAGHTAALVYTMPFWVLLLSAPVLRERVHGAQWLALALASVGLVLLLGPGAGGSVISKLLALLAGLCWAAAALYAKWRQRHRSNDALSLTAWQMLLGSLPLLLALAIWPGPGIRWTPDFVWMLGYNVFLSGALAWLLWLYLLHALPAGLVSLGMLATPAIGVLAAWVELEERPSVPEFVGMALLLLALGLVSWHAIRRHRNPPVTGQE